MTVLDEPIIRQTDPAVFKLAVRMERKQVTEKSREEVNKSHKKFHCRYYKKNARTLWGVSYTQCGALLMF